jgi:2'-5' RNA ligase
MARRLPAHLSYTSALALLPPSSIAAPIETIRRAHDKNFARWPPHINLLYPFFYLPTEPGQGQLSPTETGNGHDMSFTTMQLKADIRARIQQAVRSIEPFDVTLNADSVGTFSHSNGKRVGWTSKTMWLEPSTFRVQQLQATLQAEFKECDADKRPFTPHLSLGQADSDYAAQRLREEARRTVAGFVDQEAGASASLHWHVDKVYVITRKGYRDRFNIVGSVDLGK